MYIQINPAELSPAEIERLDALELAFAKVKDADRAFFERHPNRRHRLRREASCEIESRKILQRSAYAEPPAELVQFVALRRVTSELRLRAFGALHPHGGDDPPEPICRSCFLSWIIFDRVQLAEVEKRLRDIHARHERGELP
jgi:hypothetical protein